MQTEAILYAVDDAQRLRAFGLPITGAPVAQRRHGYRVAVVDQLAPQPREGDSPVGDRRTERSGECAALILQPIRHSPPPQCEDALRTISIRFSSVTPLRPARVVTAAPGLGARRPRRCCRIVAAPGKGGHERVTCGVGAPA